MDQKDIKFGERYQLKSGNRVIPHKIADGKVIYENVMGSDWGEEPVDSFLGQCLGAEADVIAAEEEENERGHREQAEREAAEQEEMVRLDEEARAEAEREAAEAEREEPL
jgi:hypothetical protein